MIAKYGNDFKLTFTSVSFLWPNAFFISSSRDNVNLMNHALKFFSLAALACTRSPLLGAYNSHNKPMQRHFYRPVYF